MIRIRHLLMLCLLSLGACGDQKVGDPKGEEETESTSPTSTGRVCGFGEFTCEDKTCIGFSLRCDGKPDCPDESDEGNQCSSPDKPSDPGKDRDEKCESTEFACGDGSCIKEALRCDENKDCPDGKDEEDCPQSCEGEDCPDTGTVPKPPRKPGKEPKTPECAAPGFSCQDSCLPPAMVCDGEADCQDGEDEADCVTECLESEFQCDDKSCIPAAWACDGSYVDCEDSSDELNCDGGAKAD